VKYRVGRTDVDKRTVASRGREQKACKGRRKKEEGREPKEGRKARQKGKGGFIGGTGPGLHHPAIDNEQGELIQSEGIWEPQRQQS